MQICSLPNLICNIFTAESFVINRIVYMLIALLELYRCLKLINAVGVCIDVEVVKIELRIIVINF